MVANNGNPAPKVAPRTLVLGISGASGAAYATRLIHLLLQGGHTVHLVASDYGRQLLHDELGIKHLTLEALCPDLAARSEFRVPSSAFIVHPHKDVGAIIASGSFLHHGMIVCPCSSTSLGAIATGSGSNLLCRAAMVTLKERRPLILVHRETPLSLIDIRNMETVTLAGGIICPANPGFYLHPQNITDLTDFIAGKVLDLLHIPHTLNTRWTGEPPPRSASEASSRAPEERPSVAHRASDG